jgi:uncharacterized SAM-binding protein YcdF (DUF218 family)
MAETLNYLILNFLFPGLPVLAMALAWLFKNRFAKTALFTFWGALISLWLVSTPAIALHWASWLERRHTALNPTALPPADVIVVLSGGRRSRGPEYGGTDAMLFDTVERTRYAAFLAKRTGLSVITSGGQLQPRATPLALQMKDMLQQELGVINVQMEDKSLTTLENAQFVTRMVGAGKRVLLVTSGMHMPRAVLDFQQQGLQVIAAPTVFNTPPAWRNPRGWVPSIMSLRVAAEALRETMGMVRSYVRGL